MTNDETIRQNVLDHLNWSPHVNATHIGVAVRDGIVELTGHVENYVEKLQAEHVVLSVKGVKGVAQEIEVRLRNHKQTKDDEIAERAARLLAWDLRVADQGIKVKVERGWVTLSGEANSASEREFALSDIERLTGVVGITNAIQLRRNIPAENVAAKIEAALKREALWEARGIRIDADGNKVVLTGAVRSWPEKAAVRRAAWDTSGVTEVVDHLRVDPI
jgi:osmotically-inducible protein OsmY